VQLEYTSNVVPHFFTLMHPKSFAHEQNIVVSHKNVPKYLQCTQNSVRVFRIRFNYQSSTTNFHFDSIPAHSGTRM